MKYNLRKLLFLYLCVFILAMAFAAFLDEPSHFLKPDPNCPICQLIFTLVMCIMTMGIFFSLNFYSLFSLFFINNFISFFSSTNLTRGPPLK